MTPYRSGPRLVDLFNQFGFEDTYPSGGGFPSRWMFAEQKLMKLNGSAELERLVEEAFDPLAGRDQEIDVKHAIEDINTYLRRDGCEIVVVDDDRARVRPIGDQKVAIQPPDEYQFSRSEFGVRKPTAPISSGRKLSVFLCHASDDKPTARELHHRLQEHDLAPWLDEQDLLPGTKWEQEIPSAVRSSDVVIVCLSRASITKEGYVQKEIGIALDVAEEKPDRTIFLIPLKLEECEVPDRLRQWHWLNYFESQGHERLLKSLRRRAQQLGIAFPGH